MTAPTESSGPAVADRAVLRSLYAHHRVGLTELAFLLLHDRAEAEDVVQDAFAKAYVSWRRLHQPDKALSYVRSAVMNGARSRLRRRRTAERAWPASRAYQADPSDAAVADDDHQAVLAALRTLPVRQRECLALRYYLDLGEAETADVLGISAGSVKTHVHRGLAALADRLEVTR